MTRLNSFNVKAGAVRNTMAFFLIRQNLVADPKVKYGKYINHCRIYSELCRAVLSDTASLLGNYGICRQSFCHPSWASFARCDA